MQQRTCEDHSKGPRIGQSYEGPELNWDRDKDLGPRETQEMYLSIERKGANLELNSSSVLFLCTAHILETACHGMDFDYC